MTNRSTQPAGQTTTIQQSDPWSGVRPFLERQYSEANRLYQTGGPQYTPFSQVTPYTAGQQQALGRGSERAVAGSPLQAAGRQTMQRTVQGDYLDPNTNPFLAQNFNTMAGRVRENIGQNFGGHSFGGTAHDEMLARSLSEAGANMYGRNYELERGRQQQAAFGAPAYAAQDYGDINRQFGYGALGRELGTQQLADATARFNWEQEQPFANLARFQAGTSGTGQYGQRTTSQPFYQNQMGGMLSGALAGSQMAGMLPGTGIDPWMGMLAGGYLGGFG